MLDIETFDNVRGGNTVYKALAHPLAARALAGLARHIGRVAVVDTEGFAAPLLALCPDFNVEGVYVQDVLALGRRRGGHEARPLTALPGAQVQTVLIAAFDAPRVAERLGRFIPAGARVITLDEVKLPAEWLSAPERYLDARNFATNFVFFRDDGHFATRLTTANYWAGYGAHQVRFRHILFGQGGEVLAEWTDDAPIGPGGHVIDSQTVRARFGLGPFTGQLFIHATGIAGHDVVKYALDTYATDGGPSLSCTHDANAWPSERFAGLPAPGADERVILWLQNSHAVAIPAGGVALDRMGEGKPVALDTEIPPFATLALDVAALFPDLKWPAQLEVLAGRHVVRPRYEVARGGRTRIAHVNVERADLKSDAGLKALSPEMGRGYLLPFPVLPRGRFRTIVLPTPMAVAEENTPLRLDVFAPDGSKLGEHYFGVLPRKHDCAFDLDDMLPEGALPEGGHAELVYDFRFGGEANGWLHALFRFEDRQSGHAAESSFGGHIFNTLMVYKNEPQSYTGKPPGLSTRLFLKLGFGGRESFCVLIYPASGPWLEHSTTVLELYDGAGRQICRKNLAIACSGSALVRPSAHFSPAELSAAGESGYVLIRDTTCRLFGFHGVDDGEGGFSFDHMFGF
ncbi:hypothetical protein [Acidocella sp. KAb 2-4]|uniref:hypothetical protein n=1 Tax=Acidocella sp. KAb 2-4 TaxID=2885158 RepID=UPI001D07CDED|nr:hypothetical protein [Acidocella sp. KAb 2-4]MCB5943387.1 hypothetical protein [Acidocella sp. KAb 2-4]